MPGLRGVAIGFVLLLGFTLPPLLRLRNVSTLRVLRRDLAAGRAAHALRRSRSGLAALSALILWQAGDLKLGAIALGGFAAALAVGGDRGLRADPRSSRACASPHRDRGATASRICAGARGRASCRSWRSGLGLMAMLILTLVRTEIIVKWQESMPPDMPNRFAINIQSDQLAAVQGALRRAAPRHARSLPDGARAAHVHRRSRRHRGIVQGRSAPSASPSASSTSRGPRSAASRQSHRRGTLLGARARKSPSSPWRRASRRRSHQRGRRAHLRHRGLANSPRRSRACARWTGIRSSPIST